MLKFDRWVNQCLHWIWISCRLFRVVISTSLSQNTSAVLVTLFRNQREPQMTCEIVCVSAFFPNIHVQTWEESCWISDIFNPVTQCCNRHPNIILKLIKSHQSLSACILFSLLYPIPPPPSMHTHCPHTLRGEYRGRLQKHQLLQLHPHKFIWSVRVCACARVSKHALTGAFEKFPGTSREQQMTEDTGRKRCNECWISTQINITSGCGWKTMWYIDESTSLSTTGRITHHVWSSFQSCCGYRTVGAGVFLFLLLNHIIRTKVEKITGKVQESNCSSVVSVRADGSFLVAKTRSRCELME